MNQVLYINLKGLRPGVALDVHVISQHLRGRKNIFNSKGFFLFFIFFRKTPPDIFPRNCPAAVFHFHGQAEGIGCFCFGELVPVGGSLIEPHTHTHTHTDRRQHAFSIAHYSRHVHHSRFHLSLPLSTFAVQFRVDLIKCVWHRSYLFGES